MVEALAGAIVGGAIGIAAVFVNAWVTRRDRQRLAYQTILRSVPRLLTALQHAEVVENSASLGEGDAVDHITAELRVVVTDIRNGTDRDNLLTCLDALEEWTLGVTPHRRRAVYAMRNLAETELAEDSAPLRTRAVAIFRKSPIAPWVPEYLRETKELVEEAEFLRAESYRRQEEEEQKARDERDRLRREAQQREDRRRGDDGPQGAE